MPPKGYRFVEHTADVEFIAYGADMRELFRNSLMAFSELISYRSKVMAGTAKAATLRITDRAGDMETLLWYLLQDVLSGSDAAGLFPYGVKSLSVRGSGAKCSVEAVLLCKPQTPGTARFSAKGVSRYALRIRAKAGGFSASVVIDV